MSDALTLGALSAGGTIYQTERNVQEAAKNRAFQATMSSTAAQRAVADYKAAGLNPALAYDRSASSPGGAQAQIGDPVNAGISSALRAREVAQNLANQRATESLINAQRDKTVREAANAETEGHILDTQKRLNLRAFESDVQSRVATGAAAALAIPGLRNQAEWEQFLGKISPGLASARSLAEIIRMMTRR